jgi:hypothetical protein
MTTRTIEEIKRDISPTYDHSHTPVPRLTPGECAELLAELVTCDEYIEKIANANQRKLYGGIR